MQTSFVHLRVSSEFSISRGLLRINEIVENAQKLKMPAVALTDLNNMFGMVKFFKKAEAAGIKPIAGTTLNLKSPSQLEFKILDIIIGAIYGIMLFSVLFYFSYNDFLSLFLRI